MPRRRFPAAVALDVAEPAGRIAYRPATLAQLLDVSRATVYRLIADGRLLACDVGGVTVVPHSEVERFLRRSRLAAPVISEGNQL